MTARTYSKGHPIERINGEWVYTDTKALPFPSKANDRPCVRCGKSGEIDPCLTKIIKALNDGGIETYASCCGHGVTDGWISLVDGPTLHIKKE